MKTIDSNAVTRICFVASDIPGASHQDDAAATSLALARMLASRGDSVTMLHVPERRRGARAANASKRWFDKEGIAFVELNDDGAHGLRGGPAARRSYLVHRWLRERSFDVVHFQNRGGLAHYALLARQQGLPGVGTAEVHVSVDGPSLWHVEHGASPLSPADLFERDFMERESAGRADVVSTHPSLHRWLREHHWSLGRRVMMTPRPSLLADVRPPARLPATGRRELVFVGALSEPGGLVLFCDALDALPEISRRRLRVTFCGEAATVNGQPSREFIAARADRWPGVDWTLRETAGYLEAIDYLRGPGRIAVITSRGAAGTGIALECLYAAAPFVAVSSATLIAWTKPASRRVALAPADARQLADRLAIMLGGGQVAEPRVTSTQARRDWLNAYRQGRRSRRRQAIKRRSSRQQPPLVTVCVTHHDRPELLAQALDSLRAQTYPRVEVVLVDDGSTTAEAAAYLDSLADEFRRRRWRVVRQANRYLGAARNAAARHARGRYLLFMDDDNVAKPDEVAVFAAAMTRSGADILTCFLDVFRGKEPPAAGGPPVHRLLFVGGSPALGMMENCFGDANCMVRRRVFQEIGGFSEERFVSGEDWEFLAKATLSGYKVHVVPEALAWYRQSVSGMWQTTPRVANQTRAMRPFIKALPTGLSALPAVMRELMPSGERATDQSRPSASYDHVARVAIFGSGPGGQLAIELARRLEWAVACVVDNNREQWGGTLAGVPIGPPSLLKKGAVDLVIVASRSGREAIFHQLEAMGLRETVDFVSFEDRITAGGFEISVRSRR